MNYTVVIRNDNGMINIKETMDINKNDFKQMIETVGYFSDMLSDASLSADEPDKIDFIVYNEEDVLFESKQALEDYMKQHKIESRLKSNFSSVLYVNGIPYHGEIEEGMIVS